MSSHQVNSETNGPANRWKVPAILLFIKILHFIKINERNTLFTNYNNHHKVCFLFNNTDSHISILIANLVFWEFEKRKEHILFYLFIIVFQSVTPSIETLILDKLQLLLLLFTLLVEKSRKIVFLLSFHRTKWKILLSSFLTFHPID